MSVAQQPNVLPSGGKASQRGPAGPAKGQNVQQLLLNPERAPALISKWQKLLGTDLEKIEVTYTAEGVSVDLFGKEGTPYYKSDEKDLISISVAEYRRIKGEANAPSTDEARYAFQNKFEVRLNQEFPKSVDLGDGSEAALRKAVQALPFDQRRVMLMSNKQFKSAYPNGVVALATAS